MGTVTAGSVKPLEGLRVLDVTRLLPGAYATLVLAHLGAEVIKLEDPVGGDSIRSMPPLAAGGSSVYHAVLNRGKKSVTLDLRRVEALGVLNALAKDADVLVESFRPGTARLLHLEPQRIADSHPRLVHCSITGYGHSGPYAARAGHDINYVALAGLLTLDRPAPGSPPRMPRMFLADIAAGAMNAVTGILAAVIHRSATERGSFVEIAMHEGALSWLTVPAARALVSGELVLPEDLPITGREACYNIYETADVRYVALGALERKFWRRFCEHVGRRDWIDKQFVPDPAQRALREEVAALFSTRTRDDWLNELTPIDVCLTPVYDIEEALGDPHALARGAVQRNRDGLTVGTGIRVGVAHEQTVPAPLPEAPPLGRDTDEVLTSCGVPATALAGLRSARVV